MVDRNEEMEEGRVREGETEVACVHERNIHCLFICAYACNPEEGQLFNKTVTLANTQEMGTITDITCSCI